MEATDPAAAAAEVIRTVTTVVTVAVATVEVEVVTAEVVVATEGKSRSFRLFIKGNMCALLHRSTPVREIPDNVALHAYPPAG